VSLERVEQIRRRLDAALEPEICEITDESHLHVGHAGARDGRGHFFIRIRSNKLRDLTRLSQHRLIYEALGDLLETEIHALRIEVLGGA
jgi:BolA protein